MIAKHEVVLPEWKHVELPEAELSFEQGMAIHQRYPKKVKVQFPSPVTGGKWCLSSLGWVGVLPVDEKLLLRLTLDAVRHPPNPSGTED